MFQKVTSDQFVRTYSKLMGVRICSPQFFEKMLSAVRIPTHSTGGLAGYYFYLPYRLDMGPGETKRVATGVELINEKTPLRLHPAADLMDKYNLEVNEMPHFDEGHIVVEIRNTSDEKITLPAGIVFAKGLINSFFWTDVSEDELWDVLELRHSRT